MRSRIEGLSRFARLGGAFKPYLLAHRGRLIFAVTLSLLYAGLQLLEPWPLQILFDRAILNRPSSFLGIDPLALLGGNRELLLIACALAVLLIAVVSGAVYYIQSVLLARVGQDIIRELRQDVFHQLQRLALPYHRRSNAGDLLMRLTGDMVLLREMILASLVTLTSHLLFLVAVLVLMTTVSLRLTLISVVLSPALYALFRWFRKRMVLAARTQRRREGRLAAGIEEVLFAIPMIQAYTAEEQEDERFRKITKRSARAGLRGARLEAGMQRVVEIVVALGLALVLVFGVQEILRGAISPGVFLVFLAYLRAMNKPIRGLSKVTERTARASAAAERVLEVIRAKRDVKDSKDAVDAPPLGGAIRFSRVGYVYEDGTRALEDVSFEIRPGENVALVGPSGAGKSTLLSLILRFHRPTEGKIHIDGSNVKKFTLKSLRKQISFLPQDPFILGTTVRDNLRYGRPEAGEEDLWDALRAVDLDDFVRSLPHRLDTDVRPRGQSLSGGQRQKLAMARVILKGAPILLLDEPTTAMDARTEQEVLKNFERLRAGKTTITIAHRFSTVRSADRVLVLQAGRLVEDGSPEELLRRESLFRLLADLQGFTSAKALDGPGGVEVRGRIRPDPSVKGVEKLLRDGGPRKFLRELRQHVDPGPAPVLAAVKQRVGQRALIRVEGEGRSWYVKLLRGSKAGRHEETLNRYAEEGGRIGLSIPRAVAHIPRFGALVLEEVHGHPVLPCRSSNGAMVPVSPDVFRSVGRSLAAIHRSFPPPEKEEGPQAERDRLEKAEALIARHRPDLLDSYRAALDAWWKEACDRTAVLPGPALVAVLHGDFYPAQVLVGAEGGEPPALAFLDWEETCRGEPERDVGNFEAHIILEEARGRLTPERSEAYRRHFEDGYVENGRLDRDLLDWYRRGSLLRLAALHTRPDFGADTPNPPRLAEDLLNASTPGR